MSKEKLILVGVISSAHGIKGDLVVKSFTNPPENITKLLLENELGNSFKLYFVSNKKGNEVVCNIDGCRTRDQAEALKKTPLYCKRSNLPAKSEDEFYFEDLKGLTVKDDQNQEIGIIINVLNFGAGDIIEIKFSDLKETVLFPFNKDFFPSVEKNHVILKK